MDVLDCFCWKNIFSINPKVSCERIRSFTEFPLELNLWNEAEEILSNKLKLFFIFKI